VDTIIRRQTLPTVVPKAGQQLTGAQVLAHCRHFAAAPA
jgi:hypothetical protein